VAGFLLERTINMELSGAEEDEQILLENIVDVARLDEEIKGLLAQFEVVDDETLEFRAFIFIQKGDSKAVLCGVIVRLLSFWPRR
jgi:hypothetical protein